MARLEQDRLFINPLDEFKWKYVTQSFTSPHVILAFMIYFMGGTNLFGLALFLPSIVNQLGNSPNKSQLLSVGPFGAAFVCESHYLLLCSSKCSFFPNLVTVLVSYISDRTKNRVVPLCTVALVAMAGYALYLGRSKHPLVCYRCHLLITP